MKKLLIPILFCTVVCFAENKTAASGDQTSTDPISIFSENSSLVDIINLNEIVQEQFELAQAGVVKSSFNYQPQTEVVKKKLQQGQDQSFFEKVFASTKTFVYENLNIFILIVFSILIIGFIAGRRVVKAGGQSGSGLKKSIALIRNEIPVFIKNKKLTLLRKNLAESSDLINVSETTVSGRAKGMNLGKGELMLAAKIKSFQLSNISKQDAA